jgi:hypothetical protein
VSLHSLKLTLVARAGGWWWLSTLAWACLAFACDGAFRFDQQPQPPARDGGGADGCANALCGWESKSCDAENCPLTCQEVTICQGECGSFCSARCERGSHCALTAADNGDLLCQTGANCDFFPGATGVVTCQANSTCHVQCVGGCSLRCQAGATCGLQCGAAAAMIVTGTAGC